MRTVLLIALQLVAMMAGAQRECASAPYRIERLAKNNSLQQKAAAIETFIQKYQSNGVTGTTAKMPAGVIRIPVVVHILEYGNNAISDAIVLSQIEAMNRDFRRKNADTSKIPDRFKSLSADIEIEFALATVDPKGRATTGIVRKKTNIKQWDADDKIKFSASGGSNAWDSKSYLNIWVGAMDRILGYSSVPGDAPEVDGVVLSPSAFGMGTAAPFNMGRTGTHEVGHWLGLIHMWGDKYCGDDLVSDTPPQSTYTVGCPSGMRQSCNNGVNGTMYMNFMDYADDACMQMFTTGQKNRMRSLFGDGGERASLLYSKGLSIPWSSEVSTPYEEEDVPQKVPVPVLSDKANIYPNPAISEIVVSLDASWVGSELQLVNVNGVVIQRVSITNKEQKMHLGNLQKGIYFLRSRNSGQMINEKIVKL
ncbi:M43 family zinc metalloprotease [Flavisolibacter tropicus]|uniref:M43 family zinc metalloprotease n=1 Tax=Flavisolibacter tropicus TaxID=1492898 RepID=UPI000836619D|nr:M43 family zinc metalloprotease [Flavisolibacter tropicus]